MRPSKSRMSLMLLLGLLVVAGTAVAQPGPGAERGPGGRERGPGGREGAPGGRERGPGEFSGPDGPGERFGPPPGMGGPGAGLTLPPPEVLERLGLSEAQRTKIETLLDAQRRKAIRADADVRIAEMDLVKLVEGDRPDAAAIDTAIGHLMAMRAAMLKARAETIVAMRAQLTPEQRAKLRRPDPDARWH